MALATCCALGMQDFKEAAAVMLFFQFGEFFETVAVERSRKSISSLMDLRPDFAIICKTERRSKSNRKRSPAAMFFWYGPESGFR